jgi:APA family basic amino acid/polyamine antiporter
VRTAAAIADRAGPSVVLAFLVAGVGCAFAGLCYAEFASMIPIAGSAYTYSYATMGELVAWIIGWDLVLGIRGRRGHGRHRLEPVLQSGPWFFELNIPWQWYHSPMQIMPEPAGHGVAAVHGIMNVPAVGILFLLTLLLIRGTQQSAMVNSLIVIVKVSIVLAVITLGWGFIDPANHSPLIPDATTHINRDGIEHAFGGIMGILGAAGVVFFAYIGFDAVSTAAQEAKNPKKDMPIGILGSLVICTVLYVLFSWVLSGLAPVSFFQDPSLGGEASVAAAISHKMPNYEWLSKAVTWAILAGFSSVILVMLLGQSRVFYSMSRDGLVPKCSRSPPGLQDAVQVEHAVLRLHGALRGVLPDDIVGEMTSIGTLFAFMLVCAGVWIMRVRRPDLERGFTVPLLPVVAVPRHTRLRRDDLRAGLGNLAPAYRVAGRGHVHLLRLQREAQQAAEVDIQPGLVSCHLAGTRFWETGPGLVISETSPGSVTGNESRHCDNRQETRRRRDGCGHPFGTPAAHRRIQDIRRSRPCAPHSARR